MTRTVHNASQHQHIQQINIKNTSLLSINQHHNRQMNHSSERQRNHSSNRQINHHSRRQMSHSSSRQMNLHKREQQIRQLICQPQQQSCNRQECIEQMEQMIQKVDKDNTTYTQLLTTIHRETELIKKKLRKIQQHLPQYASCKLGIKVKKILIEQQQEKL